MYRLTTIFTNFKLNFPLIFACLPQISVTSSNATKCLAEQLLLHLSTSQTALGNVGHCEVEQGLLVQI